MNFARFSPKNKNSIASSFVAESLYLGFIKMKNQQNRVLGSLGWKLI